MYSVVPFITLATFNVLLCKTMAKSTITFTTQRSNSASKKKSLTITIMSVTVAFFILTLPAAITGGYFFDHLYKTVSGRIILCFCESLAFSFHSFNFAAFLIVNKQFRREFKEIIIKIRRKKVSLSSNNNTSATTF
jgi:hypothetical protein